MYGNDHGYRDRNSNHSDDDSSNTSRRRQRTPLSFFGSDSEEQFENNNDKARQNENGTNGNISGNDTEVEDEDEEQVVDGGVDGLLSREMLKMSIVDRTDIQEEIHGVRCLSPLTESPEFLKISLQEFQQELDSLSSSKKNTYDEIVLAHMASRRKLQQQQQQNQSSQTQTSHKKHYAIEDENFRLRFLRAELFVAKSAVVRFVNYLNFVHEMWGFEIVSQRQIRFKDFTKQELKFLKKGYFQLLPFRDRSGRRVVVILGDNDTEGTDTNPTTKVS